ncbi:MAG TPA: peptide-methionine (S)-S-oxide reductase MsrA [Candidatus Limnocylindria bacterium]|nr:peptide-methionine (S)-S-oxide reductase MsrA [Candidatus Limnocylindria bacterium]
MNLSIGLLAANLLALLAFLVIPVGAAQAPAAEKVMYFAGGCFWGVEHMMAMVPGVTSAVSGYANGTTQNPTYREVVGGATGHMETVEVRYDPSLVTLEELLGLYFSAIDPTVRNRQGNDIGTQYQTGLFYADEADGETVRAFAEREKAKHSAFHVLVGPLTSFWPAEEYHQDYLVKNPFGYCHISYEEFERAKATGRKPQAAAKPEYREVSPKAAKEALDAGLDIALLDVRETYEFAAGYIPGAVNVPMARLERYAEDNLPDKDAVIYVYCRSGNRSRTAAYILVDMGYTQVYDLGGIIDWPYGIVK